MIIVEKWKLNYKEDSILFLNPYRPFPFTSPIPFFYFSLNFPIGHTCKVIGSTSLILFFNIYKLP